MTQPEEETRPDNVGSALKPEGGSINADGENNMPSETKDIDEKVSHFEEPSGPNMTQPQEETRPDNVGSALNSKGESTSADGENNVSSETKDIDEKVSHFEESSGPNMTQPQEETRPDNVGSVLNPEMETTNADGGQNVPSETNDDDEEVTAFAKRLAFAKALERVSHVEESSGPNTTQPQEETGPDNVGSVLSPERETTSADGGHDVPSETNGDDEETTDFAKRLAFARALGGSKSSVGGPRQAK
jgi:hypothetical protein